VTGATGPQGPIGPKGDPGCSCGVPGPTGAQGPAGATGSAGATGPEGKSGSGVCPCEVLFGKVITFLLENDFAFEATVKAPFDVTYTSDSDLPALLYNTWAVEFDDETVVPLCKLEALFLSFTTEPEQDAFVSLLSAVLNQTLSCCHTCGTCQVCDEILAVDQYRSIVDMPDNCAYEYRLDGTCDCSTSDCVVTAKTLDLCSFANATGEKLRGILERKQDENATVSLVSTEKEELIPTDLEKTIAATGLSSVALTYEEDGAFKVALVCLESVTALGFVAS
ncbi:MAG: collagen-like protein, partial [Eubacteriales bacterium]